MPIIFERKVFEAGDSLRLNLPGPIAKALKIRKGDLVLIWLNDNQIIIERKAKKP
jgi:antitoxin component of MazEF toxin-antitoxin module